MPIFAGMVLVTGASGFLGGELVQQLVVSGESVRILKRPGSDLSFLQNILPEIEIAEGDILDIPSLEAAMQGIEKVYHAAAVIGYDSSYYDAMYKTNIEGTANVVNVALSSGVKKLLHVSSIAAIGGKPGEVITEETKWEKNKWTTHYGITKMLAEREIWRGIQEGLNAVIVNPGIIVGAGHDEHKATLRLFHRIAKKKLPFYTNGSNGFIDVQDVAKICLLLMNGTQEDDRYILVNENLSFKTYFEAIAATLKVAPPSRALDPFLARIFITGDWLASVFTGRNRSISVENLKVAMEKFEYSNEKIKQNLHYSFIPFSETIERVAQRARMVS